MRAGGNEFRRVIEVEEISGFAGSSLPLGSVSKE